MRKSVENRISVAVRKCVAISAVLGCLCIPGLALAEATVTDPASTGSTAQAHVDITVVVPAVLSLRVGTGGAVNTANSTIDSLVFVVPAANVGNGVSVAAGVTDGDLGNGAVTVRVYSNVGTSVSLNSSVTGPLISAATPGNTIPWSQISVASAALASTTSGFTNAAITHPAFNTTVGGGSSASPTTLAAVSQLVMYEGKWTYGYNNSSMIPNGSYGGTIALNGRVTYTATQL